MRFTCVQYKSASNSASELSGLRTTARGLSNPMWFRLSVQINVITKTMFDILGDCVAAK